MEERLERVSPLVTPATRYRHRDGTERGIDRRVACEKAFRRGYLHGLLDMVSVVNNLHSVAQTNEHITGEQLDALIQPWIARIGEWYASVDERGSMVLPPGFEEVQPCE